MPTRTAVESVLSRIRPPLNADGGDIELIEVDGHVARVRLTGFCARCPTSHVTLYAGIEAALRRLNPAIRVALVSWALPHAFSLDSVVIGRNARMRAVFDYLALIGPGQGTVLVTGESGTGKEVVANTLHLHSGRRGQPFVAVSCARFSDSLIESELFGHERGAFTGAVASRPGRFERAGGGTLFLDDIDDVPMSMQVKLLRAIQNRTIERLGGTRPIAIDVRVVAGTKRDLRELVREGRFREDLFYRLNVLTVELPALRERQEDVPLLMDHFLKRFFARRGLPVPPLSPAVVQTLVAYRWPGNVRELENMCERIAESSVCGEVRLGCLGASVLCAAGESEQEVPARADRVEAPLAGPGLAVPDERPVTADTCEGEGAIGDLRGLPLDERMRQIEAKFIAAALVSTAGNKSRAAVLLGVKRSTLGDRIGRCGL